VIEMVPGPFCLCRFAAFAGDLPLFLRVHRRESTTFPSHVSASSMGEIECPKSLFSVPRRGQYSSGSRMQVELRSASVIIQMRSPSLVL
jgi:hypothetical protein